MKKIVKTSNGYHIHGHYSTLSNTKIGAIQKAASIFCKKELFYLGKTNQ